MGKTNLFDHPVKTLIVDDSALMRSMLQKWLSNDPDIEVIGLAEDAYDAREKIKQLEPDVITLDIEMPGMNGIQFLKSLMQLHPIPVVMVSNYTNRGSIATLDALEIGAIDFVQKPSPKIYESTQDFAQDLVTKVKTAAQVNIHQIENSNPKPKMLKVSGIKKELIQTTTENYSTDGKIIAIGSSTGGTEALKQLLSKFPEHSPPVVITQHIPVEFSESFAKRLDSVCSMHAQQAEHGQEILPGNIYVAPGNRHLKVVRTGKRYFCHLDNGEPVNCHKPSVDVLFESVTLAAGSKSVGIMLTGMGDDGARKMVDMHEKGGFTIAQDEASSVVWGMPGQAVKRGAVDEVLPLNEIATRTLDAISNQKYS